MTPKAIPCLQRDIILYSHYIFYEIIDLSGEQTSRPTKNYDLPSVADLKQAVESGQRITREDVSVISRAESALTGRGPLRGGPAALAQSLAMRQMNFDSKVDQVSRKPQSHITQNDAQEIQSTESRAFNRPPGIGSIASQVRTIADRNEVLGLPPVIVEMPVYVTKDDAREAQRAEALLYGGYTPGQGMAASMQSAADKIPQYRSGDL